MPGAVEVRVRLTDSGHQRRRGREAKPKWSEAVPRHTFQETRKRGKRSLKREVPGVPLALACTKSMFSRNAALQELCALRPCGCDQSFRAWGVPAAVKTAGPSGAGRRSLQPRHENMEAGDPLIFGSWTPLYTPPTSFPDPLMFVHLPAANHCFHPIAPLGSLAARLARNAVVSKREDAQAWSFWSYLVHMSTFGHLVLVL